MAAEFICNVEALHSINIWLFILSGAQTPSHSIQHCSGQRSHSRSGMLVFKPGFSDPAENRLALAGHLDTELQTILVCDK